MGDIKRKRKKFSRPRKLFDSSRINEENQLIKEFGLKNKKEVWKAKSFISKIRRRAKELIGEDIKTQKEFFDRVNALGMNVAEISDALALSERDLLERRLQTFLVRKGFFKTMKSARQAIVHRKVMVCGTVVSSPSFIVSKNLENQISVKPKKIKENKKLEEPAKAETG